VIVVAGEAPGDRLRFSVAHELGHLILHREHGESEKEMDDEADRFASEFLLPEEPMRHELIPPITLTGLAQLKPRWKVSIQALIRRARDLEIITERQYKYLFQKLSKHGWRKQEPANLAVPVEKPRAIRQMAELLYGKPIDSRRLAEDTKLTEQFVKEVMEAYREAGERKQAHAGGAAALAVDRALDRGEGAEHEAGHEEEAVVGEVRPVVVEVLVAGPATAEGDLDEPEGHHREIQSPWRTCASRHLWLRVQARAGRYSAVKTSR
jgi:hypothetical protein